MFTYRYMSPQGLANLKFYKYHGVDHSILGPIMQKWWNFAIKFMPLSIAPNMITLSGTVFLIASFLVQLYYCPDLKGTAPAWVYFLHFFCLFGYQTMDALDGKQARRTGTSSPLGELFDHGCDAISVSRIGLTVIGTMQVGAGWVGFLLLLANFVVFYCAQWEEYHTGTLELGYLNVTEAQILLMSAYLITAFAGPSFWLRTFVFQGYTIQYNALPLAFQGLGAVVTFFANIYSLERARRQQKLSFARVYTDIVPVFAVVALSIVWGRVSPTNIVFTQPVYLFLALGFLFPNMVGRIVLARICKERFNWFQPLVLPLVFAVVNAYLNQRFVSEAHLVQFYFVFCMAAYLHFALSVINALCEHLNIRCLSIPRQAGVPEKKKE